MYRIRFSSGVEWANSIVPSAFASAFARAIDVDHVVAKQRVRYRAVADNRILTNISERLSSSASMDWVEAFGFLGEMVLRLYCSTACELTTEVDHNIKVG